MAIAFVKEVGTADAVGTAATSTVTVPSGGCASGNFLVGAAMHEDDTLTVTSVTDSRSNTYVVHTAAQQTNGNTFALATFYGILTTALQAADTITITWSVSEFSVRKAKIGEFSGIATASLTDGTASAASSFPHSSPADSGTFATTEADDLLIGYGGHGDGAITFGTATSYTKVGTDVASNSSTLSVQYRIVTSTGTYGFAPTLSAGVVNAAICSAFKVGVSTQNVTLTGIASEEAIGTPTIIADQLVSLASFTEEQVGTLTSDGALDITLTGFSEEAIGSLQPVTSQLAFIKELGTADEVAATGSTSITLAASAAVGNFIYGAALHEDDTVTVTSVADSQSNSYTVNSSVQQVNGDSFRVTTFFARLTSGLSASDTITVAWSSSGFHVRKMKVAEFSGIGLPVTTDGSATSASSFPHSSPASSGAVSTTNARDLLLEVVAHGDPAITITPDASFTRVGTDIASNLSTLYMAYQIVSSTGSYTGAPTLSASSEWASILDTFQEGTSPAIVPLTGISTEEAIGTLATTLSNEILLTGFLEEEIGALIASSSETVTLTGIASEEAMGTPAVATTVTLLGLDSEEQTGTFSITQPSAIARERVVGTLGQGSGNGTITVATTPVNVGRVLVYVGFHAAGTTQALTVSDTDGVNVYTQIASRSVNNGDTGTLHMGYCIVTDAIEVGDTITFDWTSNAFQNRVGIVLEYSGLAAASILDGSSTGVDETFPTSTALSSGNVTTTVNNDLLVGAHVSTNVTGGVTWTPTTNFTSASEVAGGGDTEVFVEDQIVSVTGTYASAPTSGTATYWGSILGALKGGSVAVQSVILAGIDTEEAIGSFTDGITTNATTLTGIAEEEAIGTLTIGSDVNILTGVDTEEAIGDLQATSDTVTLTGIASEEAFGTLTGSTGDLNVNMVGIPSEEAFGPLGVTGAGAGPGLIFFFFGAGESAAVDQGPFTLAGIDTEEAIGTTSPAAGGINVVLAGVASEEAIGTLQGEGGQILVGVPSEETIGTLTIALTINLTGIASQEAFGPVNFTGGILVGPASRRSMTGYGG